MLNKPILIAAALLGGTWYMLRRYARQEQEARTRMRTEPPSLQTWEGEGGGVPVGGSRTAAQVEPQHELLSDNPMADRLASRLEASNSTSASHAR